MSIDTLETEIMVELWKLSGNTKIKKKDIMEWSTAPIKPKDGETMYFLPDLNVYACVRLPKQ